MNDDEILQRTLRAATGYADPAPTRIEYFRASYGDAARLLMGESFGPTPNEPHAVAIQACGHFTGRPSIMQYVIAKHRGVPAEPIRGEVLQLIVNEDTGYDLAGGLAITRTHLSRIDGVTRLR